MQAILEDLPDASETEAGLDFRWLFQIGRRLISVVKEPSYLTKYTKQTSDLIRCIRDGLVALGYVDTAAQFELRIDWDDLDDVWDYWVETIPKIKFKLNQDHFSAAVERADNDDGNLEIMVKHPRLENPSMQRKLCRLILVAVMLTDLAGKPNIILPVERVGALFGVKGSRQAMRKRGSRYLQILVRIGALECVDHTYSQIGNKAKVYRLVGEGTVWDHYHA
jgi:hypothetical protein